MGSIEFRQVSKSFGDKVVIPALDLSVKNGEFMVLVGPSGCGKSTLLRMIAGLEALSSGDIFLNDKVITHAEPKDRGVAMVFQNYALYPHMTVFQNMAFALKIAGVLKVEREKKVLATAETLGISEHLLKKPTQLSGGQKQRVAIGRAMVREPKVFLFDEPLSNLDAQLRVRMRAELSHLHKKLGCTIVYVTHDQVEAMTLASRICVLQNGRIEQVGTPLEVYGAPRTKFVASFIGTPPMNLLERGLLTIPDLKGALVGFRPEATRFTNGGKSVQVAKGRVALVEVLGKEAHVHVQIGKQTVVSTSEAALAPVLDKEVGIYVDPAHFFFFDEGGIKL